MQERVKTPKFRYTITCRDKRTGRVKWTDHIDNLVTTVGKNDLLDKYFEGSSYTAAFYAGLVDNAGFSAYAAGDTMASHAGWAEADEYDEATRVAVSFGAASGGVKASDAVSTFTMNATVTIRGMFVATNSTKNGTTGVLYSAGDFAEGSKAVDDTDVLETSYSVTMT